MDYPGSEILRDAIREILEDTADKMNELEAALEYEQVNTHSIEYYNEYKLEAHDVIR
jgi:Arc/MetJ-type ribon-helix-helix transcriptional regulator